MHPKKRAKIPMGKDEDAYKALWRVVDGAVVDALDHHPEYVAKGISKRVVRTSINKRVVGAVLSYAQQRMGPSGDNTG